MSRPPAAGVPLSDGCVALIAFVFGRCKELGMRQV